MPLDAATLARFPEPWPEILELIGYARDPVRLATRRKLVLTGVLGGSKVPAARLVSRIRTLEPLVHMPGLEEIDLCAAPIEDLSPLTQLGRLRHLCIWQTRVRELRTLAKLSRLAELYVWGTRVADLEPLRNLPLEELSIEYTDVETLDSLSEVRTLRSLDISGTRIATLTPLDGVALEQLTAHRTRVSRASLAAFAKRHPTCSIGANTDYPALAVRCVWTRLWDLEDASDVNTALLTALTIGGLEVEEARPHVIRRLLQRGAKPDVRDESGRAPLLWAAARDQLETVALLLEHGADAQLRDRDGNLAYSLTRRADIKELLARRGGAPTRPVAHVKQSELRVGGRARHGVFGVVTIIAIQGTGSTARVAAKTTTGEEHTIRASFLTALD